MRKATFSQVTIYNGMFGNTDSSLKVTITGDVNKQWLMEKPGLKEKQRILLSE